MSDFALANTKMPAAEATDEASAWFATEFFKQYRTLKADGLLHQRVATFISNVRKHALMDLGVRAKANAALRSENKVLSAKVECQAREREPLRTTKWELEQQPGDELFSIAPSPTALALLEKGNSGKSASSRQLASNERAAEDEVHRLKQKIASLRAELSDTNARFGECNRQLKMTTKLAEEKVARVKELKAKLARAPPAAKPLHKGSDSSPAEEGTGRIGGIHDASGSGAWGGDDDDDDFQSDNNDDEEEEETLKPYTSLTANDIPRLLRTYYTEDGPVKGHNVAWYVTFKQPKGMLGGAAASLGASPYEVAYVYEDSVYFNFHCEHVVEEDIQERLVRLTKDSTGKKCPCKVTPEMFQDGAILSKPKGASWHEARALRREIADIEQIEIN